MFVCAIYSRWSVHADTYLGDLAYNSNSLLKPSGWMTSD